MDPLDALGLRPLDTTLLRAVLDRQEVTAAELEDLASASAASVSHALTRLVSAELLDRVKGRRPATVFVHERIEDAVDHLLRERADVLQSAAHEHRTAGPAVRAVIAEAAELRRESGRPAQELHGGRRDATSGIWSPRVEPRGWRQHDQVVAGSALPALLRCRARVLTSAEVPDPERAVRHWPLGSELRHLGQPLPALWLLDEELVGLECSGPAGRAKVWSRDATHVAAARELFAAWWEQANTLARKERAPFDESDLDVDEWDPWDADPDD